MNADVGFVLRLSQKVYNISNSVLHSEKESYFSQESGMFGMFIGPLKKSYYISCSPWNRLSMIKFGF